MKHLNSCLSWQDEANSVYFNLVIASVLACHWLLRSTLVPQVCNNMSCGFFRLSSSKRKHCGSPLKLNQITDEWKYECIPLHHVWLRDKRPPQRGHASVSDILCEGTPPPPHSHRSTQIVLQQKPKAGQSKKTHILHTHTHTPTAQRVIRDLWRKFSLSPFSLLFLVLFIMYIIVFILHS